MKNKWFLFIGIILTLTNTVFTSCNNNTTPTAQSPNELVIGIIAESEQVTLSPTPEPQTPKSTELIEETPEFIERATPKTVAEAYDLLIEEYGESLISHVPDMDRQGEGVHFHGFIVDYTNIIESNPSFAYAYAWVNSATGGIEFQEAGFKEDNPNWYANIPDDMFPIPMHNDTIIPYDRFYPPTYYSMAVLYVYDDKNVMELYQAQLRAAGFVDHGEVMSVHSLWSYDRDSDGATLIVEMASNRTFVMTMYVNHLKNLN
jgi:hypothetical protein